MSNFKQALRTTVLFILVLTILSTCIMELFFSGENYYYQDAKEREALSGSLDYLICGASHAMRGFKPDVLDEEFGVNSYNMACSRMAMQGRYELLQLEMNRNPVKTLVVELSYDSLTRNRDTEGPEGDIYMYGKYDTFLPRAEYFFKSARPHEYGRLYYNYIDNGIDCLKKLIHGTWTDENTKLYKGYAPFKRENENLYRNYKKIYNTQAFDEEIYDDNIMYLQKIIDMCKERDIRVIMTTMPLSRVSVCRYSNLDVFREWYVDIAEQNGIEFYDFNLLKNRNELLPDDSAFADKFHLSNTGAQTFSETFTEIIKKVDSGEDVSDLFYNSYVEYDQDQGYSK